MNGDKEKLEFQCYAAAFLDLLGQSEILEKITDLPNPGNEEEMGRFVALCKQSFGLVDMLNDSFKSNIEALGSESDFAKSLPEDQRRLLRDVHSRPVKLQRYSDGIALFTSLAERPGETSLQPLSALWGLLAGCGSTFLLFLSHGFPLRGGIDVGVGLEYTEGELYGPAPHRAYKLESRIAQYPRIAIGPELINYIRSYENRSLPLGASRDVVSSLDAIKKVAAKCQRMIAIDLDGQPILDYLGDSFRPTFVESGMGPAVYKAFDFVQEQLAGAKKNQDFKLTSRYLMMHQYFSNRLRAWPGREAI